MAQVVQMKELMTYYPVDPKERSRLHKQFILNVAYSVVGEQFQLWVKARVVARNEKVAVEKELRIAVDPEIAEAFRKSNAVSISKGIGANSKFQ